MNLLKQAISNLHADFKFLSVSYTILARNVDHAHLLSQAEELLALGIFSEFRVVDHVVDNVVTDLWHFRHVKLCLSILQFEKVFFNLFPTFEHHK